MARLAGSLGRDPPIRIMLYNHNARKGAATTSQNFTVVEFDALQLSNNGTANLHDPPYTVGIHFGIA